MAPQVNARVAVDTYNKDRKRVERGYQDVAVPLSRSRITVNSDLEQRRDGLLWYNLYDVAFVAHYRVRNATNSRQLAVHFPFPPATAPMRTLPARSADSAWPTRPL